MATTLCRPSPSYQETNYHLINLKVSGGCFSLRGQTSILSSHLLSGTLSLCHFQDLPGQRCFRDYPIVKRTGTPDYDLLPPTTVWKVLPLGLGKRPTTTFRLYFTQKEEGLCEWKTYYFFRRCPVQTHAQHFGPASFPAHPSGMPLSFRNRGCVHSPRNSQICPKGW